MQANGSLLTYPAVVSLVEHLLLLHYLLLLNQLLSLLLHILVRLLGVRVSVRRILMSVRSVLMPVRCVRMSVRRILMPVGRILMLGALVGLILSQVMVVLHVLMGLHGLVRGPAAIDDGRAVFGHQWGVPGTVAYGIVICNSAYPLLLLGLLNAASAVIIRIGAVRLNRRDLRRVPLIVIIGLRLVIVVNRTGLRVRCVARNLNVR